MIGKLSAQKYRVGEELTCCKDNSESMLKEMNSDSATQSLSDDSCSASIESIENGEVVQKSYSVNDITRDGL